MRSAWPWIGSLSAWTLTSSSLYGTAGWLLESLGRDKEALALYRQAAAVAPERWETHQDLGMYYYQHKSTGRRPRNSSGARGSRGRRST